MATPVSALAWSAASGLVCGTLPERCAPRVPPAREETPMTDLPDFTLRPAKDEDTERLLEIHASVFPDPRGAEERRRNFHHNALGGLGDLHVVEHEGRLLAHAFLFPLEVWIGGRPVPAGGVASVGVAPEARGRRIASR